MSKFRGFWWNSLKTFSVNKCWTSSPLTTPSCPWLSLQNRNKLRWSFQAALNSIYKESWRRILALKLIEEIDRGFSKPRKFFKPSKNFSLKLHLCPSCNILLHSHLAILFYDKDFVIHFFTRKPLFLEESSKADTCSLPSHINRSWLLNLLLIYIR